MTKNNLKIVKSSKNQEIENKEKNKALEAAISQIDENFGKGSVMKLGQKTSLDIESISTGSLSLDLPFFCLIIDRHELLQQLIKFLVQFF